MSNPFVGQYHEPYATEQKKTFKILVKEDHVSGELGFVSAELNINEDLFMATTDPDQIAHDCTEHVNGMDKIGSISDEFEALGGICFVRGYDRILRRKGIQGVATFEENLASDLVRMFGELHITDCEKYNGEEYVTEIDDWIDEVISIARPSIPEEYEEDSIEELLEDSPFDSIQDYLCSAKKLMKVGYLKAEAMYNGCQLEANELFWNISEAVGRCVKSIEHEGQEFLLEIDGIEAHMEEYYGYDYDDLEEGFEGESLAP